MILSELRIYLYRLTFIVFYLNEMLEIRLPLLIVFKPCSVLPFFP